MKKAAMLAAGLGLLIASTCQAQTYKIGWYSINSGGVISSTGRLQSTIGQPAQGCVTCASFLHWTGFWSADAPTPVVCATLGDAKLQPDGRLVSVAGNAVMSAGGDFDAFFYVERPDRTSGIRVAVAPSAVPGLARGCLVNIIGTMGTTRDLERQITGPMVVITSVTTPPGPLGMSSVQLGGGQLGLPPLGQYGVTGRSGVNNIGLLVKAWGRVIGSGPGYVVISDGDVPVTVDTSSFATQPLMDSQIGIVGISSLYTNGDRYRLILPRNEDDLITWQ